MGKVRNLIGAGIGVAAVTLALPSAAQEQEEGGRLLRFGLGENLEVDDNIDLDPESAGTTTTSSTDFSFALSDQTRLDQFSVTAGTAFRASTGPEGEESFFDDQRLTFGYLREGARSRLAIDAQYTRQRIEFLRPLEDFVDENGVIDLPEDFDDLEGEGTRSAHDISARLDLGIDEPLGLTLDARTDGLDYEDVTDPDLNSTRSADFGAIGRLRFSPVLDGTLELRRSVFEEDDEEETRRETDTAKIGLDYEISPVLRARGALGFSTLDVEEFGVTETTEGSTQDLDLELDRPNGQVTASFSNRVSEDGDRQSITVGRETELPTGSLSAEIGVEGLEWEDFAATASIAWRRALPSGAVSASLRRTANVELDQDNEITTALSLGFQHQINDLSGINLNLAYALTEEETGDTENGSFSAVYSRSLTEAWSLNAGYRFRLRDESDEGRATSNSVFLGLGRSFDFRP